MPIAVTTRVEKNRGTLALTGRFDFIVHRDFREAYERLFGSRIAALDIDLRDVTHLDSSALGMLLLVRERADQVKCTLALVNCPPAVRRVFEIANFQKLFAIS